MKIKHLLIGLFAAAAAVACNQEEPVETPSLELNKEAVSLAAENGEGTFTVTSNQSWVATADADWVSLEPASGEASKDAVEVTVTAEDNETTEARTATVTVKAGDLTKTVALTQAAGEAAGPDQPGPDQPGPNDEPELELSEWALVGSFTDDNNWNPASDLYLSILDENYFVYYAVELTETTEFKFLKGGVWPPEGQEIGGNGLVEPNTIQAAGGSNIKVTPAGTYDIYLAADLTRFYVMEEGKLPSEATEPAPVDNSWGMMGCFVDNQWATDVPMTQEGEWIVAKGAQFTELTFKIRANQSWADATNIGVVPGSEKGAVNAKISVVTAADSKANHGGDAADIKLNGEAGTYDVYFSFENLEVYVMEEGFKPGEKDPQTPGQTPDPDQPMFDITELYVLGAACDTNWGLDEMTAFEKVGDVWVWEGNLKVDEFRFPLQKQSNVWWPCLVPTADGTAVFLGEEDGVVNTYRVPAEGYYKLTVNPQNGALTVEHLGDRREPTVEVTELYMLGGACDTGWDLGAMEAFTNDNGVFTWTGNLKADEKFRFPLQKVDNKWWPCLMISADGTQLVYGQGDADEVIYLIEEAGVYTITVDVRDWHNRTVSVEKYVEPEGPAKLTIAEFAALEDGDTVYELTGAITRIVTPFSSQYNNISLNIADETGEIQLYRLKCSAEVAAVLNVNDVITVQGAKGTYNTVAQMAAGGTYVSHVDKDAPVQEAGIYTIEFNDKANRTVFTTSQQVWEQNGIVVTNDKASSTSNVADYVGPVRFYQSSSLKVEKAGMTKLVFFLNSVKPASGLVDSVSDANATVTANGYEVTIELAEAADVFTIDKLVAQIRVDSLTVYAE